MADVNFGAKVQAAGIKKDDFVKSLTDKKVDEATAQSIFNKFNTNTTGESANILDKDEQVGILAFLKKLAGADTKITDDEYSANKQLAQSFGFGEDNSLLDNVVKSFEGLTSDGETVTFDTDGSITSGNKTYTYNDNIELQSSTVSNGTAVSTQKTKVKYDPVRLSSNWKMQRDVGNAIANDTDGYGEIKNKTSAKEVLDSILEKKGIKAGESTYDTLLKTFIKFNPSVFDRETGKVWLDADWTKLDFPAVSEGVTAESMVSEETDLSDVGKPSLDGWHDSSADTSAEVNGIKLDDIKKEEGKTAKGSNPRSAARYVLDQVLSTKIGGILSDENKASLLGEIIKRNPDVFTENGKLKEGVTDDMISNLKIPSSNWIKSKYGVKADGKGGFEKQQGMPTIRGNNGYYSRMSGPGVWLYYDPQGKQISGDEFKKHCPNIYKTAESKNKFRATMNNYENMVKDLNQAGKPKYTLFPDQPKSDPFDLSQYPWNKK